MKRIISIALLVFSLPAFGQKKSAQQLIRTAADLKTGKSQDVLASFFQLALEDITGREKTFRFQSSLFAIRAKTDTNLLVDTNFLRQTHARNFVFSIAPSLDTGFHFISNTIGLKYALINNRDRAIFNFIMPDENEWINIQRSLLNEYAQLLTNGVGDPKYVLARNFFADRNDEDVKRTSWRNVPAAFKKMLLAALANSRTFRFSTPESFRDTLSQEYARLARYVENRSLWTLAPALTNEKSGRFSVFSLATEFLKGMMKNNSRMNLELNLTGRFIWEKDSTRGHQAGRQLCSGTGGCNWIIIKNRRSLSLLELKMALAWDHVISGKYEKEKRSVLTGLGTLRLRITNEWWIPIDFRYDPLAGNVFGFLSVKTNFDWLGHGK